MSWTGALCGLALGAGALLVLSVTTYRVRLDDRLAPYLRPRDATSGLLRDDARGAAWERVAARWLGGTAARLGAAGPSRDQLRRRLDRAGGGASVEQHRARQVVWTVLGLAAGLGLALLLAAARGSSPVALVALVLFCGTAGYVACDQVLTWEVRRREARLLAELPTVAELLALAVTAGEGPVAALDRVARTARGELPRELARTLAAVRAGEPVAAALTATADRTGLPALARFAEAVAVALERGSPLAEVLRAQAQDVREAGRRALLESGGRREIAMMVPVVFLILPVTVVFAVFPSLATLRVGL